MAKELKSYRPPIMGTTHMVSAGHYLAASAGYRILEEGGNAVDAGVAAGIAINVTLPHATNFGGVAPIAIYEARSSSVVTVSGLGRWPRAANLEYFKENCDNQIPIGVLRTVIPSAPDAWLTALRLYGTMTFESVVAPALELAEKGFPVTSYLHDGLQAEEEDHEGGIALWPSTREIYMPNGHLPSVGEILVQSDLAKTFRRLIEAEKGAANLGREPAIQAARDRFYKGDIAAELVRFSEENGGLCTIEDFVDFSVKIEPPEVGNFRNYTIYTCGAWCQGPVVAQVLQMLEDDDLAALGHNSLEYIHLVSQALNLAYSDRHAFYGDPDHVDVPIKGLLSKGYTRNRRGDIDPQNAFPSMADPGDPWRYQTGVGGKGPNLGTSPSSGPRLQDTSYVCVVDKWGNAFSATPSDPLGGSPIVPGLGIQMSSRGSQSWLDPDHPSSLQPWKRPRLTPNPAIAFKDGKLFMPFGTPGGDTQCTSMVQLFLNVTGFGMDPQQAIEQPRFAPWNFPNSFWPHAYNPGRLEIEGRIDTGVIGKLLGLGHDVKPLSDWSPAMGALSTIVVDHETGTLKGGADPRRDSYAIGR